MLHKEGNIQKCYMRKSSCCTRGSCPIFPKDSQKGVAFLRMRHLFDRNATHEQGKNAPSFGKIHYICNMKEVILSSDMP